MLVTTQWLADTLGAPDLRIVDASYYLPEHGRDAAAEFAAGHIPGAQFLDLAELRDPGNPLPSMLPPADVFAAKVGALGISNDSRIVIYDASPTHSSARAWWMFRHYGARHVAILDGGLNKWRDEGRPVTADAADVAPAMFEASAPQGVRTLADMQANLDTAREQMVDARSAIRFAGDEPEARQGVEPGHIPGSINLHASSLYQADDTLRNDAELRAAFEAAGLDLDRPIVATCGSGITAASIILAAHKLGREGSLYDGSWAEWGSHPDTPKAKGAA